MARDDTSIEGVIQCTRFRVVYGYQPADCCSAVMLSRMWIIVLTVVLFADACLPCNLNCCSDANDQDMKHCNIGKDAWDWGSAACQMCFGTGDANAPKVRGNRSNEEARPQQMKRHSAGWWPGNNRLGATGQEGGQATANKAS